MEQREEVKIKKNNSIQKNSFWMLIFLLLALSVVSCYKLIVNKEIVFIQFAIAAALCGAILRRIPAIAKTKYLIWIPIFVSFILLVLGIIYQ
ncbi:MAG: hypothetical protein H8E57_05975 [Candidatus Cloacimonetes bacterium]|nr:hypothetical protein [Candidatus Cloacimonadota bacterium]